MRSGDRTEGRSAYFAYGSNLNRAVMKARCPGAVGVETARLDGWELCFRRRSRRWGGHAADLRARPDAATWGVIWWLRPEEWAALERFEAAYRHMPVAVAVEGGVREAGTYVVADPDPPGAPAARYHQAMVTGARHHDLPEVWCASLEAIACLPGGDHVDIDDQGPVI